MGPAFRINLQLGLTPRMQLGLTPRKISSIHAIFADTERPSVVGSYFVRQRQ
jgi:hypothetical protein